ncbi:flagellar FliJ family protein [Pseudoduganella umbonata]|uniref:Flagellar FliJ protein n=1 Tax=Pseudoduganella umbonata TaxID=864828 RepID=A0A4P8HNG2_9BURK|nr:flagellar FliJ family protein [Pseudoduganella umbonata]MBB3221430.1 flagellar export protein FliJ [Pseudoduganella umbonata]QCP10586.1 flagellar export protein FliJ [Pseudoduganella umbonata]
MTDRLLIQNLTSLVALRNTELEKLQAAQAAKVATAERYKKNLERLHSLAVNSGASGSLPIALAANCGDYKQAVLAMADSHRLDLTMHEADMAVSQRALNQAYVKCEVLGQVLEKNEKALAGKQAVQERKVHDDLATQVWLRSQN